MARVDRSWYAGRAALPRGSHRADDDFVTTMLAVPPVLGNDAVVLFFGVPMLLLSSVRDRRRHVLKPDGVERQATR